MTPLPSPREYPSLEDVQELDLQLERVRLGLEETLAASKNSFKQGENATVTAEKAGVEEPGRFVELSEDDDIGGFTLIGTDSLG